MAIFDPPKKPTFWTPFFGVFPKSAETVKSHVKSRLAGGPKMGPRDDPKKGVQKVVTILDYPWGFWSKNRHFWSKSGFLGPSNDHFLTTFWTHLGYLWYIQRVLCVCFSKSDKKGSKSWSKKWPHKICHFLGYPKKSDTPKMTKMAKNPFFDHFLTTFWPPSGSLWIPLVIFKGSPIWVSQKSDKKGSKSWSKKWSKNGFLAIFVHFWGTPWFYGKSWGIPKMTTPRDGQTPIFRPLFGPLFDHLLDHFGPFSQFEASVPWGVS